MWKKKKNKYVDRDYIQDNNNDNISDNDWSDIFVINIQETDSEYTMPWRLKD